MQTFTIGIPHGTLLGRLGGNRLVRASDRVEAIATIMLFVFAVAVIPVVASVGMSTHHHQSAMYLRRADSMHQTTASVTKSSSIVSIYGSQDLSLAQITWDVDGLPRMASITWPEHLTAGDQIAVWVDGKGKLGGKPVSPEQAVTDAVVVAVLLWSAIMGAAAGGRRLLTWRLDRHRDAQWERELEVLSHDSDGHADHRP